MEIKELKYNKEGLIPTIIQDFNNKQVLMLGYSNEESIKLTIDTQSLWFFSRSRQKLWNKGETSGNFHRVQNIKYDCDKDTLLIEVIPEGPTCHTGEKSCFNEYIFNKENEKGVKTSDIYSLLYERISKRKTEKLESSYTNYLFEKGIDKILKKVGEETSEVIIAAKNDSREEITYEISDLIYHLMVLMVEKEISINDISKELQKRYSK